MNLTLTHKRLNRVLSVLLILCTVFTMVQLFPAFTLSAAEAEEPLFTKATDYVEKGYKTAEEKWNSIK